MISAVFKGIVAAAGIAIMLLIALSLWSRYKQNVGLTEGRLRACPDRPNCVCSDYGGASGIEPIAYDGADADAWRGLRTVIGQAGGRIEQDGDDYLWATFRTPLLRFVDDMEARLDRERGVIHIRSASRVGYSDLGANRERVEALRRRFAPREHGD